MYAGSRIENCITYGTGLRSVTGCRCTGSMVSCRRNCSSRNYNLTVVTGYSYASCLAAGCGSSGGSGVNVVARTGTRATGDAAVAAVTGGDLNTACGNNRAYVVSKSRLKLGIYVIAFVVSSAEGPLEVTAICTACIGLYCGHCFFGSLELVAVSCVLSINDHTVVVGSAPSGCAGDTINVGDPAFSADNNIVVRCDVTAFLAGECTVAHSVSTLEGDHHGVFGVIEVVTLRIDLTSGGSTDTVLGNTVIEVIVYVNVAGFTYTRHTGVGVVVPVMVVGNVVNDCIAVTVKMNLTAIPEVVVGMSYVLRFLGIKLTVALCLVGIRACIAVEEVAVMNPHMVVILLKTDVIALGAVTVHESKVSYLYVRGGLDTDTEAIYSSICAYTLEGKTNAVVIVLNKKVSLVKGCSAAGGIGDVTDEADTEGSRHILKGAYRKNISDSSVGSSVNSGSYAVLIIIGNVNNYRTRPKSAVLVIRTAGGAVYECVAASVMGKDRKIIGDNFRTGAFTAAYDRHNLKLVAAGGKAKSIGTPVGRILTDEHIVKLGPGGLTGLLNVYVVEACTLDSIPSNIGRLKPSACILIERLALVTYGTSAAHVVMTESGGDNGATNRTGLRSSTGSLRAFGVTGSLGEITLSNTAAIVTFVEGITAFGTSGIDCIALGFVGMLTACSVNKTANGTFTVVTVAMIESGNIGRRNNSATVVTGYGSATCSSTGCSHGRCGGIGMLADRACRSIYHIEEVHCVGFGNRVIACCNVNGDNTVRTCNLCTVNLDISRGFNKYQSESTVGRSIKAYISRGLHLKTLGKIQSLVGG